MADWNNNFLVAAEISFQDTPSHAHEHNTVKDSLDLDNTTHFINCGYCNNSNCYGNERCDTLLHKGEEVAGGVEHVELFQDVNNDDDSADLCSVELTNVASEGGVVLKKGPLAFDIDVSDCGVRSAVNSGPGECSLQEAFMRFRRKRQEDLKSERRRHKNVRNKPHVSPSRMEDLRSKIISQAKKYFGVPYGKKYWAPDTEEHNSSIFLDCCGLVRRVMRDLQDDVGFRLGPWNQCYMFDTLPITLTREQMRPGDLVFMTGIYHSTKSKKQPHDLVHVEIWLGEGDKTIGSRWNSGKVQVFDSYMFSPRSFHSEQYIFKSIDTWLMGVCCSHCPDHPWQVIKHNPSTKSIFSVQQISDENADPSYNDDNEIQNEDQSLVNTDKSPVDNATKLVENVHLQKVEVEDLSLDGAMGISQAIANQEIMSTNVVATDADQEITHSKTFEVIPMSSTDEEIQYSRRPEVKHMSSTDQEIKYSKTFEVIPMSSTDHEIQHSKTFEVIPMSSTDQEIQLSRTPKVTPMSSTDEEIQLFKTFEVILMSSTDQEIQLSRTPKVMLMSSTGQEIQNSRRPEVIPMSSTDQKIQNSKTFEVNPMSSIDQKIHHSKTLEFTSMPSTDSPSSSRTSQKMETEAREENLNDGQHLANQSRVILWNHAASEITQPFCQAALDLKTEQHDMSHLHTSTEQNTSTIQNLRKNVHISEGSFCVGLLNICEIARSNFNDVPEELVSKFQKTAQITEELSTNARYQDGICEKAVILKRCHFKGMSFLPGIKSRCTVLSTAKTWSGVGDYGSSWKNFAVRAEIKRLNSEMISESFRRKVPDWKLEFGIRDFVSVDWFVKRQVQSFGVRHPVGFTQESLELIAENNGVQFIKTNNEPGNFGHNVSMKCEKFWQKKFEEDDVAHTCVLARQAGESNLVQQMFSFNERSFSMIQMSYLPSPSRDQLHISKECTNEPESCDSKSHCEELTYGLKSCDSKSHCEELTYGLESCDSKSHCEELTYGLESCDSKSHCEGEELTYGIRSCASKSHCEELTYGLESCDSKSHCEEPTNVETCYLKSHINGNEHGLCNSTFHLSDNELTDEQESCDSKSHCEELTYDESCFSKSNRSGNELEFCNSTFHITGNEEKVFDSKAHISGNEDKTEHEFCDSTFHITGNEDKFSDSKSHISGNEDTNEHEFCDSKSHINENEDTNEHEFCDSKMEAKRHFCMVNTRSKNLGSDKAPNVLPTKSYTQNITVSQQRSCLQDNLRFIDDHPWSCMDELSTDIKITSENVECLNEAFVSKENFINHLPMSHRYCDMQSILDEPFIGYSSDCRDQQNWQLSTQDDALENVNNNSSKGKHSYLVDCLKVNIDETTQGASQSEPQKSTCFLPPHNSQSSSKSNMTKEAPDVSLHGAEYEIISLDNLSQVREELKFHGDNLEEVTKSCEEKTARGSESVGLVSKNLDQSNEHEVKCNLHFQKNSEQSDRALELKSKEPVAECIQNQLPCSDENIEKYVNFPKCDAWQSQVDSSQDFLHDVCRDDTSTEESLPCEQATTQRGRRDSCKVKCCKLERACGQVNNKSGRKRSLKLCKPVPDTQCLGNDHIEPATDSAKNSMSFWIPFERVTNIPQEKVSSDDDAEYNDFEEDEEYSLHGKESFDLEKQSTEVLSKTLFRSCQDDRIDVLFNSLKEVSHIPLSFSLSDMQNSIFTDGIVPSQSITKAASADDNEHREGHRDVDSDDIIKISSQVDGGSGDDSMDKEFGGGTGRKAGKQSKLPQCCLPNNMQPTFFIGGGNGVALIEGPLLTLGWKRTTDRFDERYKLKWVENKSGINYMTFREGEQLVNHIPNCKLLTNKLGLLCSLQEYERVTMLTKGRLPRLKMADFVPETYKLDDRIDREKFLRSYQEGQTWICKPTGMNQGKGIFLLRTREKINQLLSERETKVHPRAASRVPMMRIVQRYISRPLLLEERKFDIRSYMSIASTVPFLVLYHRGYVRLSCQRYSEEDSNLTTHLTNQFVQKKDPSYKDVKEDTAWTMDKLNDYINKYVAVQKGVEKDWVYHSLTKQMQRITLHCFNSVKHKLQCKMGYFDLYGLDFMVDSDMKVWLIEINANPALHTNCQALKEAIPSVVEDSIYLAIECFDKSRKGQPLMPLNTQGGYTVLYCGSSPNTATHRQIRSVSPFKDITDWSRPTGTTASARYLSPTRNLPRMNVSHNVSVSHASSTKNERKAFKSSTLPTINIGASLGQKPATSSKSTILNRQQQHLSSQSQKQQQQFLRRVSVPHDDDSNKFNLNYVESTNLKSNDNSHRAS